MLHLNLTALPEALQLPHDSRPIGARHINDEQRAFAGNVGKIPSHRSRIDGHVSSPLE